MIKHERLNQHPTYSFWFAWWSDWDDVCAFDCDYTGFILQARRSRRGKLQFRVAKMGSPIGLARCTTSRLVNHE